MLYAVIVVPDYLPDTFVRYHASDRGADSKVACSLMGLRIHKPSVGRIFSRASKSE